VELFAQFFWGLYALCKQYPNATGYVFGGFIGMFGMGWYLRRLVVSLFEKYLGNNKILAAKIENHEQRLLILEQHKP